MTLQQRLEQAIAFHQRGELARAEQIYRQILALDRRAFLAWHLMGVLRLQQARDEEALTLFGEALAIVPDAPDTLFQQGSLLLALGRAQQALTSFDRALASDAANPDLHFQRGASLLGLGRQAEALEGFRRAAALRPDFVEALVNMACLHRDMGASEPAMAGFELAIRVRPDFVMAHYGRAQTLYNLGRHAEALTSAEKALALDPRFADAFLCRGNILREMSRPQDALASFEHALALQPGHCEALNNRGGTLLFLGQADTALESFDRAVALKPDYADAWYNRGLTLLELSRPEDALNSFDKALALRPDFADALYHRGHTAWFKLRRIAPALKDFAQVARTHPDYDYIQGDLLHLRMHVGDWRDFEAQRVAVDTQVRGGKRAVLPFNYLGLSELPADLQICAMTYARHFYPAKQTVTFEKRAPAKIRIGYLCSDFREHATAWLTVGLFEHHDKSRFEIIACDTGHGDGGPTRRRLEAAFDAFLDLSGLSDQDASATIRAAEIDILVNLQGYYGDERTGIFSERAAPIQVNYLGFPGTLGAPYFDYILADRCVIPEDEQRFYNENVVTLPGSYQVNDDKRTVAAGNPSRADNDLPEQAFVFCSFNQSFKLTPPVFAAWMRILKQVDGSVLWLLETNGAFPENLKREAAAQGIAANRLIFAPFIPMDRHLKRLKLADLFLDTSPYNAHTTASDAFWAGVPVLTVRGKTFASRVATSLLLAIGLPELVTNNLEDYCALAVALARDPARLKALREKLARNRLEAPLFDTDRFRRHLEDAYTTMWARWSKGEAARAFTVRPL